MLEAVESRTFKGTESSAVRWTTCGAKLARLCDTHLTLAQQKAVYTLASYRGGKGELPAVLAARREIIDVRVKQIELESKRAAAAAKLYYFYGPGAAEVVSEQVPAQENAR